MADTLAELARLGVTARPGTVADTIERNVTAVATQMGIQVQSAWRYFSAAGLAKAIAAQREQNESSQEGIGQAPLPPLGNPELAMLLAGVASFISRNSVCRWVAEAVDDQAARKYRGEMTARVRSLVASDDRVRCESSTEIMRAAD
ncbi:hypothetical protein AB0P40_12440 [Streptomyces sp. NPDC079189]|uniref:hypothetical protein n=1 Tax=Streptomyces sp. NPDC079189 TaxID=3154514 RepID=UPI0034194355